MPTRYEHWIAGAPTAPKNGAYLQSVSPLDESPVAEIASGDETDVAAAVESALTAQPRWAATPPAERSRILHAIAAEIRRRATALADLEIAETGKLRALAEAEVATAADYFEFYAGAIRAVRSDVIDLGDAQHVFTRHEPYGVIGMITPWNAPITQAARGIAPALAAGNAVVVKPSEFTSVTTLELARIGTACGLPDSVLNVVTGYGPDVGTPIVRHPGVSKACFTGSVSTGRIVATIAAERLIPVTLELGGKSPHIIFADADLDRAIPAAARAFTGNAGQVCSAGTRLIVEESVHDRVVEGVSEIVSGLRPGHELAPMITPGTFDKVTGYLDLALAEGATVATGGSPVAGGGRYVQPTVLTGVTNEMRIAREEIFGPVVAVIPFTTEEQALAIGNDSSYGLVAGVWTSNLDRALRMAARLEAGQVFVNDWTANVEAPFGGYKQSGHGREKGLEALAEYTRTKSVLVRISDH